MSAPQFTYITVTDGTTNTNAAFWNTFQNNIQAYGQLFLPLTGGIMTGAVTWATAQTFPSSQVSITDPSTYAHTGYYQVLDDHINDPIHGAPSVPLQHASTHAVSGSDILYGNAIMVSPTVNNDIVDYFGTLVVQATGTSYPGPPASSRYEMGGADPLYGNLISIDSGHPSLDIKTFVTNTVLAAIATGGGSSNASFNSATLSGGILDTTNSTSLNVRSLGTPILADTGGNTSVMSTGINNHVSFGSGAGTGTEYGQVSSAGYSVGLSNYGANSLAVAGPASINYDLTVSRGVGNVGFATNDATTALINMGINTGAYLSYNIDVASQLYWSAPATFGQNVNIANGSILNVSGVLYQGSTAYNTTAPGIVSNGSSIDIYALEGNSITLGNSNNALTSIGLGPNSAWGTINNVGLNIGTTLLGVSGTSIAGTLIANGAYAASPGDVGVARGPVSGRLYFGQSNTNAAYIDFGSSSTGSFTFGTLNTGVNGGLLATIHNDGTYVAGSSTYGPTSASIAGQLSTTRAISAPAGTTTGGNSGYAFGTDYTTGLFSAGTGDLRLLLSGTNVLGFISNTATFNTNISVPNNIVTTKTLNVTGAATVGGNLTLSQSIITEGSTISSFRVKGLTELLSTATTPSSGTTYKYVPMPAYTGGQIEFFRITAATIDNLGYATLFTIYKNGSAIGTIQLGAGQLSGVALPTLNPTPVATGDLIHAVCNAAGGATVVTLYIEMSQLVY